MSDCPGGNRPWTATLTVTAVFTEAAEEASEEELDAEFVGVDAGAADD